MPVYPQSKPNLTLAGLLRSSEGTVGATMWPTRALATRERLFDELYVWTEGYQPTTMRRARLQILALRKAFALLEFQRVDRICVTLSFGTVERALDPATDIFETNRLLAHRISVMLRGQVERLRSPYRVQSFVEWLRTQAVPVGYRLSASRIGAERKAIELLQPGFAKLAAPSSARIDYWEDALLEARVVGLDADWLIVSDLETDAQRRLAQKVGFRFGQGSAVRPAYDLPSTRQPRRSGAPGPGEPAGNPAAAA